jgi:asparagine synthase (glutamine-hydrolysing)
MCGLAGFAGSLPAPPADVPAILAAMGTELAHRGPDDSGIYFDASESVGFVHRRLSIIDLTPAGHQPMASHCGRWVIVYNGEVYNFGEIRAELEPAGVTFSGNSDTEVMLAAIGRWGLEAALGRFAGMFAFALWDRQRRELTLVRDRLGVKPLYYQIRNGTCLFASELKAFRGVPAWSAAVSPASLAGFLDRGYVAGTASIYEDVHRLAPGTRVTIRCASGRAEPQAPVTWWSLREVIARRPQTSRMDPEEALAGFATRLEDAVRLRMIADVPLGAFLSGGIDSTAVVAVMQSLSSQPVRTFTIGFVDADHDEAQWALAIARHLGTAHTGHYLSEIDLLDIVPRLPAIFDEPFADESQMPTLLLSRLTRQHVTVALSGDGGDEMLGGYVRHQQAPLLDRLQRRWPLPIRHGLAGALQCLSVESWDRWYRRLSGALPDRWRVSLAGQKLHKLSRVLDARDLPGLYTLSLARWSGLPPVGRSQLPPAAISDRAYPLELTPAEAFMYMDAVGYLPDDVLTKVDRCTMAVSLEGRAPLLDHRLHEFAWSLPRDLKTSSGKGKILLRRFLATRVPPHLWERPKMGFTPPIGQWLRSSLRDWADELLAPAALARDGLLDPAPITSLWQQHRSGAADGSRPLWPVLMFQAWLAENRRTITGL